MGVQRFQEGASLGIYTWQSQEPVNEEKKSDWQCMAMWGELVEPDATLATKWKRNSVRMYKKPL